MPLLPGLLAAACRLLSHAAAATAQLPPPLPPPPAVAAAFASLPTSCSASHVAVSACRRLLAPPSHLAAILCDKPAALGLALLRWTILAISIELHEIWEAREQVVVSCLGLLALRSGAPAAALLWQCGTYPESSPHCCSRSASRRHGVLLPLAASVHAITAACE